MSEFNWDELTGCPPRHIGRMILRMYNQIEQERPEHQVAAAAVLFNLMLKKFPESPPRVMEVGRAILDRTKEACPELVGVAGTIRWEW